MGACIWKQVSHYCYLGQVHDQSKKFSTNGYIVRNELLVAPIMTEQDWSGGWRSVYLRRPDGWFRSKFSCTTALDTDLMHHPLYKRIYGGIEMKVEARIPNNLSDISDISLE